MVVALAKLPPKIFDSNNARLSVIGCSPPERILSFSQETKFDSKSLFTDPPLGLYNALGLIRASGFRELAGKGEKSKESVTGLAAGLAWSMYKSIGHKTGDVYQVILY